MLNLGVVQQAATIHIPFSTAAADGGAEAFSATVEVADFAIYVVGSVTQRSSTAGYTVSETFDSLTGLHVFTIDLSDDTDTGFYAAGSTFIVSLTPDETVDSQTITAWLGMFTIESNAQKAVRLMSGMFALHTIGDTGNSTTQLHLEGLTHGNDALNGEQLLIRDDSTGQFHVTRITDFNATGDLATVETLPFTPEDDVDQYWRLGTRWTWPAAWDVEIESEATDALNAYDPPTKAELDTAQASIESDIATAQSDLDTLTGTDGATLATSQPNYTPAVAGDEMDLIDDAITALKYDQSTAFPMADADGTALTEAGGDGDHLTEAGGDGDHLTEAGGTGDQLTALATAAALTTLDTVADRIEVDTQDIQSRIPAALVTGRMSSDMVALSGSTTAADAVEASALGIIVGEAATGTLSTTVATTDLAGFANDQLIGRVLIVTSGDAEGEATDITDYASANGTLTFTALTTAMGDGDTFVIV
jgi:hypothetical protein